MAALGPPPGLRFPQTHLPDQSPSTQQNQPPPPSTRTHHLPGRLTAGTGPRYGKALLLKLGSSPLVPEKPEGMPPLSQWFGDWEPYTPKPLQSQHHQYHQHSGAQTSSVTQGYTSGSRNQHDGGMRHYYQRGEEGVMGEFKPEGSGLAHQGGGYLPGFQGVRSRGGDRDTRYRKNDGRDPKEVGDSSGRFAANGGHGSRYPTGKNPFGQVSASGTFRPAGKDPDGTAQGKFPIGRMNAYGRDREPDEAGNYSRQQRASAGQPRRRNQVDESQEDNGDWETVLRSPDTERKLTRQAGGLADSASDWRRGPSAASGPPGLNRRGVPDGLRGGKMRGDETSARRGALSISFPPWMAEDLEPSWMNDDGPSSSSQPAVSGERRGRGKLNFDAFKGSENIHITPREGEDSIQAFKREMKERERRAREQEAGRAQGNESASGASVCEVAPPPGLAKPSKQTLQASVEKDINAPEERSTSAIVIQDGSESTATRSLDEPSDSLAANNDPSGAQHGAALSARGTSRFARFFDGAAAINKAREAQERALTAISAQHPYSELAVSSRGLPNVETSSVAGAGLNSLFRNMERNASADKEAKATDMQRKPSEADVEGMQKIMAMLRAGGGNGTTPTEGGKENIGSLSPHPGATGLMAMLKDGGRSNSSASPVAQVGHALRQSTQEPQGAAASPGGECSSSPQQMRHRPPGLDVLRYNQRASGAPSSGGKASPSPSLAGRSQSPKMSFHPQQAALSLYGMPTGFLASPASPGLHQARPPMQPFVGMDPLALGHRPPPPGLGASGAMPTHFASIHGGNQQSSTTPPGPGCINAGHTGQGGNNVGGLLSGLPPHIQQQLMGLPPHVQHSILTSGGPMPPPLPGHLGPHQHFGGGGFGPIPPPPPGFMPIGGGRSPGAGFAQRPYPAGPPQHLGPYAQQLHPQQQPSGPGAQGIPRMHGQIYSQQGGR